jgi:hypothetical protein
MFEVAFTAFASGLFVGAVFGVFAVALWYIVTGK